MSVLDGQTQIIEKTTSLMCVFSALTIGHLFYSSDDDGDVCIKISENNKSNVFNFEKNEIQTVGNEIKVFKSKKRYIKGEW